MWRDFPRRQRSHGTATEHTGQPDMQGTFLLLHLLTRVAFEMNEFSVTYLGLEVEAF